LSKLLAEGAPVVAEVLQAVPSLRCLVTSRQRLMVEAEREFVVLPLARPEATPAVPWTPEKLARFASVQLFVDRAQEVRPDFQITRHNAGNLAALCDRLEGIPLAIELAAARALALTPAQLLSQLARRYDLLVSRRRDLPERQRTLRGAMDWSYRLLAPERRRFFAHLSAFRGGWTLAAAASIADCGLRI
jgi:predicted ATPase